LRAENSCNNTAFGHCSILSVEKCLTKNIIAYGKWIRLYPVQ
jgi:hypothetical protein